MIDMLEKAIKAIDESNRTSSTKPLDILEIEFDKKLKDENDLEVGLIYSLFLLNSQFNDHDKAINVLKELASTHDNQLTVFILLSIEYSFLGSLESIDMLNINFCKSKKYKSIFHYFNGIFNLNSSNRKAQSHFHKSISYFPNFVNSYLNLYSMEKKEFYLEKARMLVKIDDDYRTSDLLNVEYFLDNQIFGNNTTSIYYESWKEVWS